MSSFDQVIKNILSDIFGSDKQEDVLKPKLRPSGLGAPTGTSPRPRLRPDQEDEEVKTPSASEITSSFISSMADYEDSDEEGVEIPLAKLQADARNLNGKYKTTAMQLAKLNKGKDGATVRVASVEDDTSLDDLLYDVQSTMDRIIGRPAIDPSQPVVSGQFFDMSISDIQTHLKARGYDAGKVDGKMGAKTRSAIKAFQKDQGLVVDGIAGKNTQRALQIQKPEGVITFTELGEDEQVVTSGVEDTPSDRIQRILESDDYVSTPLDEFKPNLDIPSVSKITVSSTIKKTKEEKKDVQRALLELGYDVGEVDGIIGTQTRAAIRQFQKDNNLSSDAVVGKNTAKAMNDALSSLNKTEAVAERTIAVDDETGMPKIKDASLIAGLGDLLGRTGLGTSEFRFFAGNLTNPGSVRTEDSLNSTDIEALRSAVNKAIENGRSYTTYEDFGFDEMEVNKYSALSGVIDPDLRMARSIGVFRFTGDDKGNIIIEDTFDFNPGPKRIAYYEAVKKGDRAEKIALLSDATPVQAASMVGYAKQESLKEQDKPYQTEIKINLGKPKTW